METQVPENAPGTGGKVPVVRNFLTLFLAAAGRTFTNNLFYTEAAKE